MTEVNNSKLSAFRSAPFTTVIASNGYHVKDNRGYIWAVCRDEGYANIIRDSLMAFGTDYEPKAKE